MKIELDKDINGYQEARKFGMLLEHCIHSGTADPSLLSLIESLRQQLNDFILCPEFRQFHKMDAFHPDTETISGPLARNKWLLPLINSFLHTIMGPGRRELILSRQRQELIERAEHAESSAFAALAETADVSRERDEALQKISLLEAELGKVKSSR